MSNVIPKEKLTAYERWEMASFGDDRKPVEQNTEADRAKEAEERARLREEARLQGYAEGQAEGFEQGRKAGLETGRAQASEELQHMRDVMGTFDVEVAQANETIANDMLELALDVAKAMLKSGLAIRPQLVLPVVSEAIRYLPSLQQPALLFLHPQDAELVRHHMADELGKAGWRVAEDHQMQRGGCRVETATNQIDASTETRWQRITDALGKQTDWLE
jgi:flagellar assembly protein FliH